MTGGHVEPDPHYYQYWAKPCGQTSCRCVGCGDSNCIDGYDYDCSWDNFHYLARCRLTGGQIEWLSADFTNATGATRNDLHWRLEGALANKILAVNNPNALPHVEIASSGTPASTLLGWSGGNVPDGDTVQCGVMINWDTPGDDVRFEEPAYWSFDTVPLEAVAGCASVRLNIGDMIDVVVNNTSDTDAPALEVSEFSYAFSETGAALADLSWDNLDMPWVSMPWQDTIAPGGSAVVGSVPFESADRFMIVRFSVNFSGDPPENRGHMIVQRELPQAIPAVSVWGLVAMGLLLIAAGTCVLGRRVLMAPGCPIYSR